MDAIPQFMLAGLAVVLLVLGIIFAIMAIVYHRRQNASMPAEAGEASPLPVPTAYDAPLGASFEDEVGPSADSEARLQEGDADDEFPTLMSASDDSDRLSQDDGASPTDAGDMAGEDFSEFEVTKSIIAIHVSEIISVS